ncbi:MAG: GAF domain-containing protein [bacterium]|nr:GAF domain-containing protein [bacterium]
MSAGDFLVLLAQTLLLVVTCWKLAEWARRRDGARRDVALLLLSFAIGVVLHWLQAYGGVELGIVAHVIPMVVVLHPLLMLRLADHFRTVPRWISALIMFGVLASWAMLLATPPAFATHAAAAVRLIFSFSLLYATRALVAGARHAQGVVRRRMGLLGAGAIVIVLLAVLHALAFLTGGLPQIDGLTQVGLLAATALYSLGLAPPAWLSRSWQQADVQQFLLGSTSSVGESTDRTLARLCSTALHATGGQAAALASWNAEKRRLELELRGERALVGGPLPADGLVARNWTFRRPFVADNRKQVREACLRMAPGLDCTALLGVPLITPSRVWGLVIVFLRRGPVLPDEDLRLLTLITEHTAVMLDQAALVESLRREIAHLRGEPIPDETPFDES